MHIVNNDRRIISVSRLRDILRRKFIVTEHTEVIGSVVLCHRHRAARHSFTTNRRFCTHSVPDRCGTVSAGVVHREDMIIYAGIICCHRRCIVTHDGIRCHIRPLGCVTIQMHSPDIDCRAMGHACYRKLGTLHPFLISEVLSGDVRFGRPIIGVIRIIGTTQHEHLCLVVWTNGHCWCLSQHGTRR